MMKCLPQSSLSSFPLPFFTTPTRTGNHIPPSTHRTCTCSLGSSSTTTSPSPPKLVRKTRLFIFCQMYPRLLTFFPDWKTQYSPRVGLLQRGVLGEGQEVEKPSMLQCAGHEKELPRTLLLLLHKVYQIARIQSKEILRTTWNCVQVWHDLQQMEEAGGAGIFDPKTPKVPPTPSPFNSSSFCHKIIRNLNQMNGLTAFIDGSQIYGSDKKTSFGLRSSSVSIIIYFIISNRSDQMVRKNISNREQLKPLWFNL